MKKSLAVIMLLSLIVCMLCACAEQVSTSSTPVSESNEASASSEQASETVSNPVTDGYEDSFEHNGVSYTRLSGKVFAALTQDGVRMWSSDNELGSFFARTFNGIELIAENRFLAHSKQGESPFSVWILNEKGNPLATLNDVCEFAIKKDHILISYPLKDNPFSKKRTAIFDTEGKAYSELYWELLSETVPEGRDCDYLGLRESRIYEIELENGKATEKEIKPLSETVETIYETEVSIRKYEPLSTESDMFCGGYWVYLNGEYDYYGSSLFRHYTSEEPIFTNGFLLLEYDSEPKVYFARSLTKSGRWGTEDCSTVFLSVQFREGSEYMIAEDGGLAIEPWVIIDKNGNEVYREEFKEILNENGEYFIVQIKSIVFDTQSDNPNAIIITDYDGEITKTTIEKLIN